MISRGPRDNPVYRVGKIQTLLDDFALAFQIVCHRYDPLLFGQCLCGPYPRQSSNESPKGKPINWRAPFRKGVDGR